MKGIYSHVSCLLIQLFRNISPTLNFEQTCRLWSIPNCTDFSNGCSNGHPGFGQLKTNMCVHTTVDLVLMTVLAGLNQMHPSITHSSVPPSALSSDSTSHGCSHLQSIALDDQVGPFRLLYIQVFQFAMHSTRSSHNLSRRRSKICFFNSTNVSPFHLLLRKRTCPKLQAQDPQNARSPFCRSI